MIMTWGRTPKPMNADGNLSLWFLGGWFCIQICNCRFSRRHSFSPWWSLASPLKASQSSDWQQKEKCVLWFIQPMLSLTKIFDPVQELWGKRKPWDEYDDIMVQKREGGPRWNKHVFEARTSSELPSKEWRPHRRHVLQTVLPVSLLKLRFQHRKRGQKLQDSTWLKKNEVKSDWRSAQGKLHLHKHLGLSPSVSVGSVLSFFVIDCLIFPLPHTESLVIFAVLLWPSFLPAWLNSKAWLCCCQSLHAFMALSFLQSCWHRCSALTNWPKHRINNS